ncbi:MAG: hypothetical protein ACLFT4_06510, partial [Bacteroidales bacterium]
GVAIAFSLNQEHEKESELVVKNSEAIAEEDEELKRPLAIKGDTYCCLDTQYSDCPIDNPCDDGGDGDEDN